MRLSVRSLVLTALVAFAAGLGGAALGARLFAAQKGQPTLHAVLHERLDLTPEQLGRIERLETSFAARKRALELEMRAANAELGVAIREEHGYGPRVTAAIERFHDAMGRLQTETIAHMFAMRDVLDDEQSKIFEDTVVTALTSEPP